MSFKNTADLNLCGVSLWRKDCLLFLSSITQLNLNTHYVQRFPGGSDGKEAACNVGDLGLIPGSGRSPGKGSATHSSNLAWRIPRPEEPGGLQSTGSHRVRYN